MRVSEIFTSINGEPCSMHMGSICTFIRFQGCSLRCSYCDTGHAQQLVGGTSMTPRAIIEAIKEAGNRNITITGGEPLLQSGIGNLLYDLFYLKKYNISVETNGTIIPPFQRMTVTYVMDYKLPSSGMFSFMNREAFKRLSKHDYVKFVVGDKDDFNQAGYFIRRNLALHHPSYVFSPVKDKVPLEELLSWMMEDRELHRVGAILGMQLHKMIPKVK